MGVLCTSILLIKKKTLQIRIAKMRFTFYSAIIVAALNAQADAHEDEDMTMLAELGLETED